MARQGVMLTRPTVSFAFKWTRYTPDWYDATADTYYEVIGSRQRFQAILPTLDLMAVVHPEVDFRVVTPSGERIHTKRHDLYTEMLRLPHGPAVVLRAERERASMSDIAREIKTSAVTLHRAIKATHTVRPEFAERLLAYANGAPPPIVPRRWRRHECNQHCLDAMELYALGFGVERIAQMVGMSGNGIYRVLRDEHGIKMRERGRPAPCTEALA